MGFAKLHLREVLKVDETVFNSVYGLGAGLFFIGYFIFEVPAISSCTGSAHGCGVHARIMIVWGFVSMAMMFINSTTTFYVMRFILGAAEAGFFPGVILYLTYWYPSKEQAADRAVHAGRRVRGGGWFPDLRSHPRAAWLRWNGGLAVALHAGGDSGGGDGFRWCSRSCRTGRMIALAFPSPKKPGCRTGSTRKRRRCTCTRATVWRISSPRVGCGCSACFIPDECGQLGYEMWLPSIIKSFSGKSNAISAGSMRCPT